MASEYQELAVLQRKLERLEREVRELKEVQPHTERKEVADVSEVGVRRPGSLVLHAEQMQDVQETSLSTVKQAVNRVLHDLLSTLLTIIQTSDGRVKQLLLVASADSQQAHTEWPIVTSDLVHNQNMEPLATLCAACGNPTRVKLLQVLYVREECTKTELSQASGANGGNLYQQLGELHRVHLLTQPRRGHYRLTAQGRSIVEVLFWCADQVHRSPVRESGQVSWFDQEEPD